MNCMILLLSNLIILLIIKVGNTSLHLAAYQGFSQTLQLLIAYRANVHLSNQVRFSSAAQILRD